MRLLDETTTLKLDGFTVRLRPSLRCALAIAGEHGPEPADFCGKLFKGHLGIVADLFAHGIEDDEQRARALAWLAGSGPLRKRVEHVTLPLYRFTLRLAGFDPDDMPRALPPGVPRAPITFAQSLAELFAAATGVLCWHPEVAWGATPREITQAVERWGKTHSGEISEEDRARRALSESLDRSGFETLRNMKM